MRKPLINLVGERFGSLVVTERAQRKKYWHCECNCGSLTLVRLDDLRRGRTRSCGCVHGGGGGRLGGKTHADIGALLGMSRPRVAEIEKIALHKLRTGVKRLGIPEEALLYWLKRWDPKEAVA